jgi:hypothetical protein
VNNRIIPSTHAIRKISILSSLKETALELRYILKNNVTFSNLSVAIVSQKYREFSMQVENRE